MTRLTVGILVRPPLFEILPNSGLRFHIYSLSLRDVPLLVGHPSVEDHLAYFVFLSNSATPSTLLLAHALVSTSECVLARDSGSELLGHSQHILTFTRYCCFLCLFVCFYPQSGCITFHSHPQGVELPLCCNLISNTGR